ncbi:ATP-binding protein [Bacteriovoracaceae bacterium]|nr:ATP-binding protein [Bacteriovoracaceae bacterium]
MKHKYSYTLNIIWGSAVGLLIPFLFVALDIDELGIPFTPEAIIQIIKSQRLFIVSFLLFPILFASCAVLYTKVTNQYSQLATKEEYFDKILNNICDCVILMNDEGIIIQANSSFERTFGLNQKNIENILELSTLKQNENSNFESSLKTQNDKNEYFLINNVRVEFQKNDERFFYRVVSLRNIDDFKKLQEQSVDNQKLASLGEVAGNIAHEINNPLTIIMGDANQLKKLLRKEGITNEKIWHYLNQKIRTVKRISTIVKSMLNIYREEELNNFKPVDLVEIVEDIESIYRFKMKNLNIEFMIHPSSKRIPVPCNQVQISQVILNLIGHAVDSCTNLEHSIKRSIDVNITDNDDDVKLIISDNGLVSAESTNHFAPLFTTIGNKTGLGLNVMTRIMETHNASIHVETISNGGTQIVMKFEKTSTIDLDRRQIN